MLLLQVENDVPEQPQMGVFIAVDVPDLLGTAGHFTHASEVVEKHESGIEVDPFQDVVRNQGLHQLFCIPVFEEVIVQIANELIPMQQVFVVFPLIQDLIPLFREQMVSSI